MSGLIEIFQKEVLPVDFLNNKERLTCCGYYLVLLSALVSAVFPKFLYTASYVALMLAAFRFYKFKERIKIDWVLMFGIIIFFSGLLISSSFAPNYPRGYEVIEYFFKNMWPFLISGLFVNTRRQLIGVLTVLVFSIAVPSVYAAFQGFRGEDRAGAYFSHVNRLAFFLDIYIPLLYVLIIDKAILSVKRKLFAGTVLMFAILALVYTGTRGAWLAIGFTFLIYALIKIRHNKRIGIALCIALILLSASLVLSDKAGDRFATLFDPNFVSNSERILIWQSAVDMWRDYPITGVGLNNFKQMEEIYLSPLHKEPFHNHAHNVFLNFLAETGLVGLVGLVSLFACIFYRLTRSINNPVVLAVLLITGNLLLHGLVDYNFYHQASMLVYWFILGLSIASTKILYLESRE